MDSSGAILLYGGTLAFLGLLIGAPLFVRYMMWINSRARPKDIDPLKPLAQLRILAAIGFAFSLYLSIVNTIHWIR